MLRKSPLGSYRLKGGEGSIATWTDRALQRIGLVSEESNALVEIQVPGSAEEMRWKVRIGADECFECTSLYELTGELGKRLKGEG